MSFDAIVFGALSIDWVLKRNSWPTLGVVRGSETTVVIQHPRARNSRGPSFSLGCKGQG